MKADCDSSKCRRFKPTTRRTTATRSGDGYPEITWDNLDRCSLRRVGRRRGESELNRDSLRQRDWREGDIHIARRRWVISAGVAPKDAPTRSSLPVKNATIRLTFRAPRCKRGCPPCRVRANARPVILAGDPLDRTPCTDGMREHRLR